MLTIGYVTYTNSDDMRARFLSDRLDIQRGRFFEESGQPHPEPRTAPSVLHLAGAVETEAARALTRMIRAPVVDKLPIVTADPTEVTFQPHTWYAPHVYNAYAVVAHRSLGTEQVQTFTICVLQQRHYRTKLWNPLRGVTHGR